MIQVEFTVSDDKLIKEYEQVLQHVPDFVNVVTNRTVNRIAPQFLADLQREPGPVKTPIRWTSDRQRRYVMAAKRRGEIASPYSRTHAVARGWTVEVVYTPGELSSIEANNPAPETGFVVGLRQQQWMADTGWQKAEDVIDIWQAVLTDEIESDLIKAWYAIGGENA